MLYVVGERQKIRILQNYLSSAIKVKYLTFQSDIIGSITLIFVAEDVAKNRKYCLDIEL